MITLDINKQKKLLVKISGNQFQQLLNIIKACPSRRWDNENNQWVVEINSYSHIIKQVKDIDNNIVVSPNLVRYLDNQKQDLIKAQTRASVDTNFYIPGLKIDLFPFQKIGVKVLSDTKRCLLADSIGTGKTVTSIATILHLYNQGLIKKALIISPKSIMQEWERMINEFTIYKPNMLYDNREYDTDNLFNIINFDGFVRDVTIKKCKDKKKARNDRKIIKEYDLLIVDEAHKCSNSETERTKKIREFAKKIKYFYPLSATPLQNKLVELYTLIRMIDPSILGDKYFFVDNYCVKGGWQDKEIIGYKNLDDFVTRISPVVLRRTRDDVAEFLPPKTEVRRWVELTKEQKIMYNSIKNKIIELENDEDKEIRIKEANILAQIQYIRQVCVSTYQIDKNIKSSAKLDELEEIVENVINDGNKLVVYCFYKDTCDLIIERFKDKGVVYLNSDSVEDLTELKKEFQKPENNIFLMTKVGDGGLNLDIASCFVFMNPEFNPKVMEQLYGRIERLTQKKPIEIIQILCKNTYEERILDILDSKIDLSNNTVEKIQYIEDSENKLIRSCL